jgi:hypothetical protein
VSFKKTTDDNETTQDTGRRLQALPLPNAGVHRRGPWWGVPKNDGVGPRTAPRDCARRHCKLLQATNLDQYKKAISFHIPNKISAWYVWSASGNPTKSVPVNDVVNTVRKMECRKQGRPSCTKQDMKREEYRMTMRILEAKLGNYELQGKVPTMLKVQFHIIARTDDITNLETGDLRSHNKFGAFALQTKVSWIKNVMEERSCSDQILLGAADTDF